VPPAWEQEAVVHDKGEDTVARPTRRLPRNMLPVLLAADAEDDSLEMSMLLLFYLLATQDTAELVEFRMK
jgi:hypothetical protein